MSRWDHGTARQPTKPPLLTRTTKSSRVTLKFLNGLVPEPLPPATRGKIKILHLGQVSFDYSSHDSARDTGEEFVEAIARLENTLRSLGIWLNPSECYRNHADIPKLPLRHLHQLVQLDVNSIRLLPGSA